MPIEKIVIDVNVFMNAMSIEPRKQVGLQPECRAFLDRAHVAHARGEIEQWQPPIFILEMFAVMNRAKENHSFERYEAFTSAPLPFKTEPFTDRNAYDLQSAHVFWFPESPPFTKAGDLVYLSLARTQSATLITVDDGLLRYGVAVPPRNVPFANVVRPSAWRPELAPEAPADSSSKANAPEGA